MSESAFESFRASLPAPGEHGRWIERRESPEFARGIKMLEDYYGFSSHDKIVVLSTALELKKASEVSVIGETQGLDAVERMLSDLGVLWKIDEHMTAVLEEMYASMHTCPLEKARQYVIANSEEALTEALHAMPRESVDHAKLGSAMELPRTAVDAFGKYVANKNEESVLDPEKSELTEEEKAFLFFRLSKDSWMDEIEWIEQIIAGVKEYSPKIYEQVMNAHTMRRMREN